MNSDFQDAFREKYPNIRIVYDHLRVVNILNEKVINEIRKDEIRCLNKEGKTMKQKNSGGRNTSCLSLSIH